MQLGALLEDLTVARARAGIEKLVHLTPQTARVITGGGERIVPAEEVRIGDILRVLPGESIPVDGVITSGQTSVNQAVMTGESLPVDKLAGDQVSSGTVNQFGAFEMRATKVGEDSSIQRMIRLVQSADAGKAKIVGMADRWATWIVVIALTAAAVTWLVTGEIIRGVTILVVFCPCALVLATPTAIMAAIGNATKHGFLIREGDALERLAKVTKVAFDKTGTLTYGTPKVTAVENVSGYSEEELFALTVAAEQFSEHPLGKAVIRGYGKKPAEAKNFRMIPGEGVQAVVSGKLVKAGNLKMMVGAGNMEPHGSAAAGDGKPEIPDELDVGAGKYLDQGCTVIYVSVESAEAQSAAAPTLAGYLVLSDTVREESRAMLGELQKIGAKPVLLTGDNQNAADAIGKQLGIQRIHAGCLPEDKLHWIASCQEKGDAVCMIPRP